MVGWHHPLDGHEFEQALGDDEGQGSLEYSSPLGHRVGHDWETEQQQIYLRKRVIKFIVNQNKSNMRRKTSGGKMRGNLVKKRISAKEKVYYNWNSLYNVTQ